MRIEKIKLNDEAGLTVMLHTPTPEMASTAATKRAAVIICPGGAYEHCSERESDPPAAAFLEMGMQVLVLNYSTGMKAANKRPLCEIAETIKIVRENSERWQIDAHKIAVCGFSAGGHLAASLGVHWNDPEILKRCHVQDARLLRPDAVILAYPVITTGKYANQASIARVSGGSGENLEYWSLEKQVQAQTPPVFLWHTMNDDGVPVENSFLFVRSLHAAGIDCECHFLASGPHGMSIAAAEVDAASENVHIWLRLCHNWLREQFER